MALAVWSTSIIMARHRARYRVHSVIVRERTAVSGEVGELVEEA
jgi:hypothetical protein